MAQGTWNIAEVEIVESTRHSCARFARLASLWAVAFLFVCAASLIGFGVAEAAPVNRLSSMPGPAVSAVLAGILGGSGGLMALLWRRIAGRR
jgi:hypothetical protein